MPQIRVLQRRLHEAEHRMDAGSSGAGDEDGDGGDALYAEGEVHRLLAHSRRAAAEMERYGQVGGWAGSHRGLDAWAASGTDNACIQAGMAWLRCRPVCGCKPWSYTSVCARARQCTLRHQSCKQRTLSAQHHRRRRRCSER